MTRPILLHRSRNGNKQEVTIEMPLNYSSKPWEMTGDNAERLRALWDAGVPTRTMAKALNISVSTLWLATKRMDLKRRVATNPQCAADDVANA